MGISELLTSKQRELLAEQNAQRLSQQGDFPKNALLWAALGPGWTASLARSAGFPSGGNDPGLLLDQIAEQGFTVKSAGAAELHLNPTTGKATVARAEDLYTSGEQAVREIIETTTDSSEREGKVKQCIEEIARGLRAAQAKGTALPNRILKWLELAERINSWPSAKDYLLGRVDEKLAEGDQAAAVAWVEAAFPLERALEGPIALGVRLAGLRVQLHQRRPDNQQYLQRFLRRDAQIQAFRQLLDGPEDAWALHYAGPAGVGKTMLVRYLESHAAPEAGALTARVDFDYLNPEYPSTKPALLLIQFAGELRLADKTGAAAGFFQSFFDKAQTLHERIGGQTQPANASRVDDPEFQSLLEMFASAVQLLPGRVVLILDTCEELAKMKPDGSPQAGVEVTFQILKRLHDRVPSLRVVFCGRRPLASSGPGWSALRDADSRVPRTYLRLHEIRSFSEQEARQYLEDLAECPKTLVEPVLRHCLEKGYTPLFSTSATAGSELRYNPFELSLYAAWVRGEPGLEPGEVAATTLDQYIRTRILGRIENRELAATLPAIAWVGAVDDKAMAQLTGLPEGCDRVAQLSAEMERQEWAESGSEEGFLVPAAMRQRLLDYYAANDRAAYDAGRNAAAAYLERMLPETPVRSMLVLHLEAALEALQPEPERAARWWQAIESRILEDDAWDWVLMPTLRLLADEHWPASVLAGKHIRASMTATRAAAQIHTGDLLGAQETSRMMQAEASSHPDEQQGRHLVLIAQALRAEIGDYGPEDVTEETGAAQLTGLEWALENPSVETAEAVRSLRRWLDAARSAGLSLEQQAFVCMLTGRSCADESDRSIPRSYFQAAFGMASFFEHAVTQQRWRFWIAPPDLSSRLRLEFLRWAWPGDAGPAQLEWWLTAPPRIENADSDRLASAVLKIQAAHCMPVVPPGDSREIIADSRNLFRSEARLLSVHRRFEPYFATAAEELAYAGKAGTAMELLTEQSASSESAAAFSETVAADRAMALIIKRFRLRDEGYTASESLEHTDELEDRALVLALQSLSGIPPAFRKDDSDDPVKAHLRWTTAIAPDRTSAEPLVDWARQSLTAMSTPPVSFTELSCWLDLIEANQLALKFLLKPVAAPIRLAREIRQPLSPDAAFIIRLRMWSLGKESQPDPALVHRIGIRRAAAVALELGELLALRLPHRSLNMLWFACRNFRESGDIVRETIASACLALALVRAGRTKGVRQIVKHLTKLFAQQRNDLINPDAWNHIEAAVKNPSAYPGLEVQPAWTRPWLLRIASCVALSRDRGLPGECSENVLQVWRRVARQLPPESVLGARPEAVPLLFRQNPGMTMRQVAPPTLRIECLDKVGRLAAGNRIRLSLAGNIAEVLTPLPTAPYRDAAERAVPPEGIGPFRSTEQCVVDRGAAWVSWESILDPTGKRMYRRRTNDVKLSIPNLLNWDRPSFHTLTFHHPGADLGGSAFGPTRRWSYSTDPERLAAKARSLGPFRFSTWFPT